MGFRIDHIAASGVMARPDRRASGDTGASFADAMVAARQTSDPGSDRSARSEPHGISSAAIETNFDAWSRQRSRDGAGEDFMSRVNAARTAYLGIARKAESSGGFDDPLAFVHSLDAGDIQVLQTIQSVADPIDPSTLSEEGALNLLLPRTMARDLDGDGRTMVGTGSTIVFPPGDAPQAVKDAWAKTTEGMDFVTRLHLDMSMHLAGNASRNAGGGLSGTTDYRALVDGAIESAEFNLHSVPKEQAAFAARILDALGRLRANLSQPA